MTEVNSDNDDAVNWELCFFCQTLTSEKLVNPTSTSYDYVAENLMQFHKLCALATVLKNVYKESIILDLFVSEDNLKNVFRKYSASWHKSCYLKCCKSKLQRAEARCSKKLQNIDEDHQSTAPNTRSRQPTEYNIETCLFCDLPGTKSQLLHQIMKKSLNDSIIEYAKALKDYTILGKVSERCDLMALEAKYHKKCLNEYTYRYQKTNFTDDGTKSTCQVESITFAELVAHINEVRKTDPNTVFKVVDLAKFQTEAMKNLGVDNTVHSTRLKDKLMKECPYLTFSESIGKPSLISFKENVDSTLRFLETRDYDKEGFVLCEVAKNLRSDIFDKYKNENNSSSVPASLIALVSMILYGPTNYSREDDDDGVSLCIAELLNFHAIQKHKRGIARRHTQTRETSTPVYVAAKLYGETRQKKLVETMYKLGLSISYDRLQTIVTEKANEVCELYHKDHAACPPQLLKGLFTTAAVDNIDHNPSSGTATSSFHGTAITLMQHSFPAETGSPRELAPQNLSDTIPMVNKRLKQLPSDYAVVPPCFVDIKKSICPQSEIYTHNSPTLPFNGEKAWLESTMTDDSKIWAAHHSTVDKEFNERHSTKIVVLPLFKEQSHTPAMMLHAINVVTNSTKFLNPQQIPVLVADQPLYAILKQLQYLYPLNVGEDKLFVMMGGLHIEMAALKLIGQLLNGSGWVEALVLAKVTTQGRSESMITASNVVRTRYAHQVTAAALYSMQKKAYEAHLDDNDGPLTFQEWRLEKNTQIPQFKYWDLVLNLELTVLQFIRSIRTGDFKLYLHSIRALLPWFFSLDHVNYSRWLSVHLRDLVNLEKQQPDLYKHFESGKFVARKTNRPFTGIALDQAHEQVNALLKGDGGMIGLTESPDALQKWLLAGPELAAMVEAYENDVMKNPVQNKKDITQNHADTPANRTRFISAVKSLEETICDLGNPFVEESLELFNLDTKHVPLPEVINTIRNIEKCGEEQYLNFCKERLHTGKSLHEPIKQNKFALFNSCARKSQSKLKNKITGLKNDCSLFSRLYIATCEHRTGNLDAFFAHENQATPPSLSTMGKLRAGTKADLLKSLLNLSDTTSLPSAPPVSAKILDGPAIVHMLSPGNSRTFLEYADNVFVGFLRKELENVSRLDLVWDRYDKDSLKNSTREARGSGSRTRVTPSTKIPKGWANFLRDGSNKEELFQYLTSRTHSHSADIAKDLYATDGQSVLSNSVRDKKGLEPCNHEEADTRMMVHLADAVAQGHTKVMLRTVDTDVVVLAVACIPNLPQLDELWVHIGTNKNHKFISCHGIAAALGPEKTEVLAMFHAFTGCDNTSFFCGKGKKSAFDTWSVYPTASEGFKWAMQGCIDKAAPILETFVIAMYDKSGSCTDVNSCRKQLFTKKDRALENLPPTKDALNQHLLRAIYQGGFVWKQLLVPEQDLPCPSDWGWAKEKGIWEPVWTTLPQASSACIELVRCKCKASCNNRCSCVKRHMKCTELCGCGGDCL